MGDWLQHLRSKPPQTRKRIALGTSAAVTSLVFVMWITVLNHGFVNNGGGDPQLSTNTTQTASPLSAFSSNAASAYREFRSSINSNQYSPAISPTTTSTTSTKNQSDTTQSQSSYWGGDLEFDDAKADSGTGENAEGEEEPFTSRNYNPNEESGWFEE